MWLPEESIVHLRGKVAGLGSTKNKSYELFRKNY
tara:strand:- start:585 stop:686 length:102 start_codon:yes stop_codon:yes gene_type:complete